MVLRSLAVCLYLICLDGGGRKADTREKAFPSATRCSRRRTIPTSVASRGRELAIRSALGATQADIRKLIFGEGFQLIAGGVLAGVVLAIVLSRVLSSFLFEVEPTDPPTLIVAGALFIGVALLACWVPVRRAVSVDPMVALRYE